ncbi:MAG: class I tRNA ligase family protein, partial [Aeriscardovia sp.]|nr:class I tRNA ligase family protein [Aeriscardovia sp.]
KGYRAHEVKEGEDLTELDRFILSSLASAVSGIKSALDAFSIAEACRVAGDFIDCLTNWYIRNSRQRFWREDKAAFDTLYTVLETFSKAAAPLLPFECEAIFRSLTGKDSVHLEDWPDSLSLDTWKDPALEGEMNSAREIVSLALSIRKEQNIRVRQPLSKLTVVTGKEGLQRFEKIIKREMDVKEVEFLSFPEAKEEGFEVEKKLALNPRALGPRLGGKVQNVIRAAKAGDWKEEGGKVEVCLAGEKVELLKGEYSLSSTLSLPKSSFAKPLSDGGFVILDCAIDEDLEEEGIARDFIRQVQEERKKAGFKITDRIRLSAKAPEGVLGALEKFREVIARETLAVEEKLESGEKTEISLELA